jgi:hypothetical protein
MQHTVYTPEDTYFIRGLQEWSKFYPIDLIDPEISVSLQKDGYTLPLRPFGYVIEVEKGGIMNAFDRDVTSKIIQGKKTFAPWTDRNWREYKEDEMHILMENTRKGSHNEIWVRSRCATIVGGYVVGEAGKGFVNSMERYGYPIKRLKTRL